MFESLYRRPFDIARHRAAPYAEERERYLAYCHQQGYAQATVQSFARELLWAARKLSASDLPVTPERLEAMADNWQARQQAAGRALSARWTRARFIEATRSWLRFLGWWYTPAEALPFAECLDAFVVWMAHERGLAPTTIRCRCWFISRFLRAYGKQDRAFANLRLSDIDTFLAQCGANGWQRVTINHMAEALRVFLRYAATQGWCDTRLAGGIQGPRIFAEERLPAGPSWSQVQTLLAKLDTDKPKDIRDRAILMLFAIYGLRAGEVAVLRLDAIDWQHNLLKITRPKQREVQAYPLVASVGNALVRYLLPAPI
jgi:site-specific recombinase XerD